MITSYSHKQHESKREDFRDSRLRGTKDINKGYAIGWLQILITRQLQYISSRSLC